MTVRIGVDVGGTFTKAVAYDMELQRVTARASIATTHDHRDGVAHGVVQVVDRVARDIGTEEVDLVTHSTTQAVNALLEGDVAVVGLIGMARRPDVRKARKRTTIPTIDLGHGRSLRTLHAFLDVTDGLTEDTVRSTIQTLVSQGAESIAAAGAFAPDDTSDEALISRVANEMGVPVTTSAELSGLYGLEMRAVTAALNASILPIATRTAHVVERGVKESGLESPVMVMRGDGGATDLEGFRTAPARTLYSGPAASVAGALRSGRIDDGVIVEVGGTSSNIAAIRRGQPALSYVHAGGHSTAIRALDVRVVGVAGGSMLRVRRHKVYGVGPRSAHIAGCLYACFVTGSDLSGATMSTIAPRPGDPDDYVVLTLTDGRRVALTNTCAANALGMVQPDDHASGDQGAALAAFAIVGSALRLPAEEVARRMLQASTQAVGDLISRVARDHHLEDPVLVAVGGGAGGLGRALAQGLGHELVIPEHAEVISAVGDALSLIRVEHERTVDPAEPFDIDALIATAETEALEAGANVGSLDTKVVRIPDRNLVRVTVTGAVGLRSGAVPGRDDADADLLTARAAELGLDGLRPAGQYWLGVDDGKILVLDRHGDVVLRADGEVVTVDDRAENVTGLSAIVSAHTRQMGPMTITPEAWIFSGTRMIHITGGELSSLEDRISTYHDRGERVLVVIGKE